MPSQKLLFEVRRKKSHYFLEAKRYNTVDDLKELLVSVTNIPKRSMHLWTVDEGLNPVERMQSNLSLSYYGFTAESANEFAPAVIGLQVIGEEDQLDITPVSFAENNNTGSSMR